MTHHNIADLRQDLRAAAEGLERDSLAEGVDVSVALQRVADLGMEVREKSGLLGVESDAAWVAHLLHAEATVRTRAPEAYGEIRRDLNAALTIPSTMPWTRTELLNRTPEVLALNWRTVDETQSVADVSRSLARNERIGQMLWRGPHVSQDLEVELADALARDPEALRLGRQVSALGVTVLAGEHAGQPSVAHDREVNPSSVERMDLTALEFELIARVQEAQEGGPSEAVDLGHLVALQPGAFSWKRRMWRRLLGLLPDASRRYRQPGIPPSRLPPNG